MSNVNQNKILAIDTLGSSRSEAGARAIIILIPKTETLLSLIILKIYLEATPL